LRSVWLIFAGVAVAFVIGTALVLWIRRRLGPDSATGQNLVDRAVGWAWIIGVLAVAFALGRTPVVVTFALCAIQGLRELVSRRPISTRFDYPSMALAFYGAIPAVFVLSTQPAFAWLAPATAAAIVAVLLAAGRLTTFRFAVLACVLGLAYVPALLYLPTPAAPAVTGFVVLVVQASDIAQYVSGRLLGRHQLSRLSPGKTWEGVLGGLVASVALAEAIRSLTPFTVREAAGLAALAYGLGVAGGQVLSAVKRDLGLKDWSTLIPGHGGMLDRVDSLLLSVPAYYHALRWLHGG
jgi:phosphatidate cytidylyltransferase